MEKHEVVTRLVIVSESQEQAEEMASVKLKDWMMKDSFSHNGGITFVPGNLIYWDIIRKERRTVKCL